MRVLVCGSRNWSDGRAIRERLRSLPRGSTVVHGGARGADRLAGEIARTLGFEVHEMPAHWFRNETFNRRAGLERNIAMLETKPDLVIAFWKDGSTGTAHTIEQATRRGIALEVHHG